MVNEKQLRIAAKEMNEVMGLEPPINVRAEKGELESLVRKGITYIDPVQDEFTELTQGVIDELSPKVGKGKIEDVPDEDEEETAQDVAERIHKKNVDDVPIRVGKNETVISDPDEEEEEELEIIEDEEEEVIEKPAPKKVPAEKPSKSNYSRIDSICLTLKGDKPKTIESWATLANQRYVAKGGKDNLKESKTLIRYLSNLFTHFGISIPTE